MARALTLARRGGAGTAPNPQVGCVIVSANGQLLGEGWHIRPGAAHAEIQALDNVRPQDKFLIRGATFYVTLEPCAHVGRTPPCADRLVAEQAGRVVIAVSDPFPAVNGKGIERLRKAGIDVDVGLFADEAMAINERFWVNTLQQRPWVTLKWAQSRDGFIDPRPEEARTPGAGGVAITGHFAQIVTHQLRAQHHSILVGRKTAEIDEPALTNRLAPGKSPLKWVAENSRKLPANHPFFANNTQRIDELNNDVLRGMFSRHGVHSLMIEGGQAVLQHALDNMTVDEVVILQGESKLEGGLPAPRIPNDFAIIRDVRLQNDHAFWLRKNKGSASLNPTS